MNLQDDKPLRRVLTKLADSFDAANGNWVHSSYELQKVAVVLKDRQWTRELGQSLKRSIQRRLNRRHMPMAFGTNNYICTQHVAENAVANIRRYQRKGIEEVTAKKYIATPPNFINLAEYV